MPASPEGTVGGLAVLATFGLLGGALLGALFDVMIISLGVDANQYGFVVGPWIALIGAIGLPTLQVIFDRSRRAKQSAWQDDEAHRSAVDGKGSPTASSDPTDQDLAL